MGVEPEGIKREGTLSSGSPPPAWGSLSQAAAWVGTFGSRLSLRQPHFLLLILRCPNQKGRPKRKKSAWDEAAWRSLPWTSNRDTRVSPHTPCLPPFPQSKPPGMLYSPPLCMAAPSHPPGLCRGAGPQRGPPGCLIHSSPSPSHFLARHSAFSSGHHSPPTTI